MTYVYNFVFHVTDLTTDTSKFCKFQIRHKEPGLTADMIDYARECVQLENSDYYRSHHFDTTLYSLSMTSIAD